MAAAITVFTLVTFTVVTTSLYPTDIKIAMGFLLLLQLLMLSQLVVMLKTKTKRKQCFAVWMFFTLFIFTLPMHGIVFAAVTSNPGAWTLALICSIEGIVFPFFCFIVYSLTIYCL